MKRPRCNRLFTFTLPRLVAALLCLGLTLAPPAAAAARPASAPAASQPPGAHLIDVLRPQLSTAALAWIAAVAILLATVQSRPLFSRRTLDGLVLALMCLLLALRDESRVLEGDPLGWPLRSWAYLLLSLSALYWLVRGVLMLTTARLARPEANLSDGAALVLLVVGVFVAFGQVATAPISDASKDGIIGGICLAETGKLPYGDAPGHDRRSPLLYALHAAVVPLLPPTVPSGGQHERLTWEQRAAWLDGATLDRADLISARLVNAVLLGLLLIGVAVAGTHLHSPSVGMAAAALVCLFPGALECVGQPDVLLAATLLIWSLVAAFAPVLGGLAATLVLVAAGLAWPWAWLLLPGMVAYFLRRGWQAVGAVIGLVGGAAGIVALLPLLVAPSLPRADGALAAAGLRAAYRASLTSDGAVAIEKRESRSENAAGPLAPLWRFLLESEDARVSQGLSKVALPTGVNAGAVLYRQIDAADAARAALQAGYREALAAAAAPTRTWTALRTVLEQTWKPASAAPLPRPGAWEYWSARTGGAELWTILRRVAKVVLAVLALFAAIVLFGGAPAGTHQLVGATLAIAAGAILVSESGALASLAWLVPVALVGSATYTIGPPAPGPAEPGPAPRITIER